MAGDLDLVGHASLFQLVCVANTPIGQQVLLDWLLNPAPPEAILLRQAAVADLAPRHELRERLQLEGRLLGDRGQATERFLEWAEGEPWLLRRPWLLWLSRLVPGAGLVSIVLGILGWIPPSAAAVAVLSVMLGNFLLSVLFVGAAHDIFARIRTRSGEVRRYLDMFRLMYSMPDSASELDRIKRDATERGGGVLPGLGRLNRIALLASIHHSPMLFILVYLPAQFLLLYDFQILARLERWQIGHGRYARNWFSALGEFEALCSLGTLLYDNPGWTFPEVAEASDRFEADDLAHPLLPGSTGVPNDVVVGPRGSFLLVTGSNMSGKSTLLRAIGVNAVLAQAGGPVAAARLRMPPVMLATSMRVHDSLEDGVSFYMAELMRLKEIVDLARSRVVRGSRTLLYLLDEILLGTNSRERHIAVVRVLEYLLRHEALGAISTHDLELASSEPLASACRCVHFRETLQPGDAQRPMTFDYRLRDGVASTSNALKLLELVGLDEDQDLQVDSTTLQG
jgi:hypothetical protein